MVLGNSPSVVSIKVSATQMTDVIQSITAVWKKLAPHQAIRYSFLDESYERMYDDVRRIGSIFTGCSVFAIIVACLGLFALSAFMTDSKQGDRYPAGVGRLDKKYIPAVDTEHAGTGVVAGADCKPHCRLPDATMVAKLCLPHRHHLGFFCTGRYNFGGHCPIDGKLSCPYGSPGQSGEKLAF